MKFTLLKTLRTRREIQGNLLRSSAWWRRNPTEITAPKVFFPELPNVPMALGANTCRVEILRNQIAVRTAGVEVAGLR